MLNKDTVEQNGNFYCKKCGHIKDYSEDDCEECIIRCSDCKRILKPEDKGKTWQELFHGFPAHIKCDEKIYEKIDRNMKILDRPQLEGHRGGT